MILTVKTVGTYVAKNKNIGSDEDEPEGPVAKKAATKRRPAPAVVEPAAKKKRSTMGRVAPAEKGLAKIPVVQDSEISLVPAATPKAQPAIETGEPGLEKPVVVEITGTAAVETEEEKETEKAKEIEPVATKGMSLDKFTDSKDTEPLSKVLARTEKSKSDEESMPINDLLAIIPANMMLPSVTAEEPTKIKFGLGIEIPEVNDGDWYKASLPKIAITDKGKAPLVMKDEIKGHPAREMFLLIFADIDFLVQLREKVIDEIVSFFSSFSLRRLVVLGPLSDIAAKEE
ncbi:hypothetical protein F511_33980 [Dorcoceras hygrometricum]|uniref:Splicing factor 3B subunit 1-like n=1 Tax=Dorcoceras hygrometricum TaxID=472368 RepID=A0A2Z7AW29_9LAMI|nr:hypothetical protein F511_33980 [Dorcoceras hygrometricum]